MKKRIPGHDPEDSMPLEKNAWMVNEMDCIIVKGAREHNLKNIDVRLPKKKLIVFTGVSGSGKSSLAFDTIFAEGQRRYIESLSSYARQFIGQMEKPKYETIKGLSPTISIEQKSASKNPRSTVGTITEIYDYLRVLFARIGVQYCSRCGKTVGRGNAAGMVEQLCQMSLATHLMILAPVVENRKGEFRDLFEKLKKEGYTRLRIDGVIQNISDVQSLSKNKKHQIEVVVDRLSIKSDAAFRLRLTDSVEIALKLGKGKIIVHTPDGGDLPMSEFSTCCGIAYPELDPTLFSFNSPKGMCPECNGLGTILSMDASKIVPDQKLSINEGAVVPWKNYFVGKTHKKNGSWGLQHIMAVQKQWGIDFDLPWKSMPEEHRELILFGAPGEEVVVNFSSAKIKGAVTMSFEGVMNTMMRRYLQTQSESQKTWYGKFMSTKTCPACNGRRLKSEVLHVRIAERSVVDLTEMTIGEIYQFFNDLSLSGNQKLVAEELLKEITARLRFLLNVGLDYLSLDRKGPSLSGGESQRIRLASQIGSELTGVLYVLDEPSIGLHQRDNLKLLRSLRHLRDIGNTLIVVEHDQETIEAADWILDIGPGAGKLGGEIIASGTPDEIRDHPRSLTGLYLSGKEKIPVPSLRRQPGRKNSNWVVIKKASENNLRNISARFPLGLFTVLTGVSGAGKSTLLNQILYPALARKLHNATLAVGKHGEILGLENLDKIINIDQKAIGRTPRSNPATYTKVFDLIRDLFAELPESKSRGYKKGRFSFNVKGGRCEHCKGDGSIKVEMHFLADVFVPCEICGGKRFNASTLEVLFKGYTIDDILNLSVREACSVFANQPGIITILNTLQQVGLAYIKLGQSATTLSGGEAQRIKLARELAKKNTGRTLFILDEPTTGLHFNDIKMLLEVLQQLVSGGNTVIVIEHNLDVIKCADWVIDLGPEGGKNGGQIIAEGPPEKVVNIKNSYTGIFLKKVLDGPLAAAIE
ncbi:excinuclease ABC subunit UvrA [bacterium]|nr:excinuclease ABC subunit UvrA [bacterium]